MSSLFTTNEETMQAHERRVYNRTLRKICISVFIFLMIPTFAITRLAITRLAITRLYAIAGYANFIAFGGVVLIASLIYAVYRSKKRANKVTFYSH
jgi:hypothetical protein